MSENSKRKEKITKLQKEKGISKENAQKQIAQKSIEDITGKSATQAANEAREILEVYDAIMTQDPHKITKEKRDTNLKTVKDFQEKLAKHHNLSDDLVHAGLGSEQLSVTAGKLEDRIDEVAHEMEIHGENSAQSEFQDTNDSKNENQKAKNSEQESLYSPPNIPQMPNLTNTIEDASNKGSDALSKGLNNTWVKTATDASKGIHNVEKAVADTAGDVVGSVAQKGTEKVLGDGIVGKTAGKLAKGATKDIVAAAIMTNLNGLGK